MRVLPLALVYFTGGKCDAILLTMPSLVYVLALSGGIHIINYYHDAIRDGCPLDKAPDVAIGHGWFPCTMAAVTTALGLMSLIVSHVIPISKFGLYSALGVVATLAMIFLYLPALLYYYPSRKFAAECGQDQGQGGDRVEPPQVLANHRRLCDPQQHRGLAGVPRDHGVLRLWLDQTGRHALV